MTEGENVEIVRRLFADWAEGKFWDTGILDPNIRFETFMPDASEDVRARGLDELSTFLRDWFMQWRDYRLIGDEFRAVAEDKVFVSCRQMATGRQSGAEVVSPGYASLTLKGGKVVELILHYDEEKAREAAALKRTLPLPGTVELARRFFAAISGFDLEALLELTDRDVEFRSFFAIGETGEYHGHPGIRQYMSDLRESWESLDPEVADLLAVGEVVLAVGTLGYRGRESGVEARDPAGWLFKFRDGKMVLFRAFREPAKALEAVGDGR